MNIKVFITLLASVSAITLPYGQLNKAIRCRIYLLGMQKTNLNVHLKEITSGLFEQFCRDN